MQDTIPPRPSVEREIDDPAYRAYLDRRFAMLDAHRTEATGYAYKLSAWMIAQLFIANAGGITLAKDVAPREALMSFVLGMIAAMGCSLAAWWQGHMVVHEVYRLGDPNAYFGREHLAENDPKHSRKENLVLVAAVTAGVVSLACFALGALTTLAYRETPMPEILSADRPSAPAPPERHQPLAPAKVR